MTVTVVRYTSKPDRADENQALAGAVYAELAADQPEGLRYMTLRLADGVSFIHVAVVDTPDGSNPLQSVAAFGAFQQGIGDRLEAPPIVTEATVVGAYGFTPDELPAGSR